MSEHHIKVIEVGPVVEHPNADALEITHVGGWQCVVPKGEYIEGDRAIYIEPDYVVDTTYSEFAFLDRKALGRPHRLRAVKLRGALSYGLIIPVPDRLSDVRVGDDVMEELGVTRYEPPVKGMSHNAPADSLPPPQGLQISKFDLENIQNYEVNFDEGEWVFVTEKLHGANARFVFWEGQFFVGSRRLWVDPEGTSIWARVAGQYPGIQKYCENNPGHILYGEAYGDVQEMKYGHRQGQMSFAAFAIYDATTGRYIPWHEMMMRLDTGVPSAPLLWQGPWNEANEKIIYALAEEDSMISLNDTEAHLAEGVVITPSKERERWNLGRVAFKYISKRYWFK